MEKKKRVYIVLPLTGLIILALVSAVIIQTPYGTIVDYLVRGFALYGYIVFFIAVISSSFMKQLYSYFGKPFITIHHTAALTALTLMVLHPFAAAIQYQSLTVFVPQTSSFTMFLYFAGVPALYLVLTAVITAFLSRKLRKSWRYIHLFNYAAFVLVTIHAVLMGTDFQSLPVKAAAFIMAAAVLTAFAYRRYRRYRQMTG